MTCNLFTTAVRYNRSENPEVCDDERDDTDWFYSLARSSVEAMAAKIRGEPSVASAAGLSTFASRLLARLKGGELLGTYGIPLEAAAQC